MKTHKRARDLRKNAERPKAKPFSADCYVFNRIGLFPKLGTDLFYLHGPHQPRAVIHLEGGKTFTIIARNAGPDHIYIQKATLNGRPLKTPWISQRAIMAGGQLEVVLGAKASRWGQAFK